MSIVEIIFAIIELIFLFPLLGFLVYHKYLSLKQYRCTLKAIENAIGNIDESLFIIAKHWMN